MLARRVDATQGALALTGGDASLTTGAGSLPDHVIVATVSYTDVKRRVRFNGPMRAASYAPVRRTVTFEG